MMAFPIQSFAQEMLFQFMEYSAYGDQISFLSSCREWNSWLKVFRRLVITEKDIKEQKGDLIEKVLKTIQNPSKQLTIRTSEMIAENYLQSVNYSLQTLVTSNNGFIQSLQAIEGLHLNRLQIEHDGTSGSLQPIFNQLEKLSDCQELSFKFSEPKDINQLPYFPSLQSLSIANREYSPYNSYNFLVSYCHTLQKLVLYHCDISDVTMLGSIPHLELRYCHEVEDISSLNHNESIVIERCGRISDYSQSFAKSKTIVLDFLIPSREYRNIYFDMTRWENVKKLIIDYKSNSHFHYLSSTRFSGNRKLPITVEKCRLSGRIVRFMNITVTSEHRLQEIELALDNSIKSLEGRGFEQVASITCDSLMNLQSLQGLGRGRNRRITICNCEKIIDFTPIGHIPIVKIFPCRGFIVPSQLRFVRDLTIHKLSSKIEIDFHRNLSCQQLSYEHVQSLEVNCDITDFEGLETIPHLSLPLSNYSKMEAFLTAKKKLRNQRIRFSCPSLFRDRDSIKQQLLKIHEEYLKDVYEYVNNMPHAWIWIRK